MKKQEVEGRNYIKSNRSLVVAQRSYLRTLFGSKMNLASCCSCDAKLSGVVAARWPPPVDIVWWTWEPTPNFKLTRKKNEEEVSHAATYYDYYSYIEKTFVSLLYSNISTLLIFLSIISRTVQVIVRVTVPRIAEISGCDHRECRRAFSMVLICPNDNS
jgi:hypothetical protein